MPTSESTDILLELTSAVGPATAWFARRLFEQATHEACQQCLDLLCFARWFTPARVERAVLRLMDYGVQDADSLRLLLEHDLDSLIDRSDAELDGQLRLGFTGTDPSHQT